LPTCHAGLANTAARRTGRAARPPKTRRGVGGIALVSCAAVLLAALLFTTVFPTVLAPTGGATGNQPGARQGGEVSLGSLVDKGDLDAPEPAPMYPDEAVGGHTAGVQAAEEEDYTAEADGTAEVAAGVHETGRVPAVDEKTKHAKPPVHETSDVVKRGLVGKLWHGIRGGDKGEARRKERRKERAAQIEAEAFLRALREEQEKKKRAAKQAAKVARQAAKVAAKAEKVAANMAAKAARQAVEVA